jgi:hypothetical protein
MTLNRAERALCRIVAIPVRNHKINIFRRRRRRRKLKNICIKFTYKEKSVVRRLTGPEQVCVHHKAGFTALHIEFCCCNRCNRQEMGTHLSKLRRNGGGRDRKPRYRQNKSSQ